MKRYVLLLFMSLFSLTAFCTDEPNVPSDGSAMRWREYLSSYIPSLPSWISNFNISSYISPAIKSASTKVAKWTGYAAAIGAYYKKDVIFDAACNAIPLSDRVKIGGIALMITSVLGYGVYKFIDRTGYFYFRSAVESIKKLQDTDFSKNISFEELLKLKKANDEILQNAEKVSKIGYNNDTLLRMYYLARHLYDDKLLNRATRLALSNDNSPIPSQKEIQINPILEGYRPLLSDYSLDELNQIIKKNGEKFEERKKLFDSPISESLNILAKGLAKQKDIAVITEDNFNRAFKSLALECHPDRQSGLNEEEIKKRAEKFNKIKEASVYLTNNFKNPETALKIQEYFQNQDFQDKLKQLKK